MAAIQVADRLGSDGVTIRRIAESVGVTPMAVYHYFDDKEAILDAMVDSVFTEIGTAETGLGWRETLGHRARSMRTVLRAHPWATTLIDSRTSPGPATLHHQEALLADLRSVGLSYAMIGHAVALIDAFVYGFAVQETSLPFDGDDVGEVVGDIIKSIPKDVFPHLSEMAVSHVLQDGYDFGDEFEWGLELILDALAERIEEG